MGHTSEILSPELALVDPDLTMEARAALVAYDETPTRSETPVSWVDDETLDALQRIVELSDVEPPKRQRRHRSAKLVGATATWGMVAVLIVNTQLYTVLR